MVVGTKALHVLCPGFNSQQNLHHANIFSNTFRVHRKALQNLQLLALKGSSEHDQKTGDNPEPNETFSKFLYGQHPLPLHVKYLLQALLFLCSPHPIQALDKATAFGLPLTKFLKVWFHRHSKNFLHSENELTYC